MSLNHEIKLAIHQQFFKSFADMPKGIQKKCMDFLKKFKEDPTSDAINYEPIHTFKDPQLKTCRVDQSYRLIMRTPEEGNTYLILWVDQKLKAMAWAKNKVIHVNEHNQAIEIMDVTALEESVIKLGQKETPQKLFAALNDQQLTDLGVSAPVLALVKLLDSDESFANVQPLIPSSVFSYLSLLRHGFSYEEVLTLAQEEHQRSQELTSTTLDDVLQLSHNQELFVVITEDEELERSLNAPSEQWRIFLHSSQREIVNTSVNGSVRVLGGAGTGKTVVAMHRVKWLIENVLQEEEHVLFTTFTTTLTSDLKANLQLLLTSQQYERVELMNLDQLVKKMLEKYTSFQVAYWNTKSTINPHSIKLRELWDQALMTKPTSLTPEFMRMEWEQVILAQGIHDLKGYLRALRKGRGTQLSMSLRKQVWACFEVYIDSLLNANLLEPDMAMWEITRKSLEGEIFFPYRAVVLDEIQDMSTAALRMIRVLTPKNTNDLFLVGDGHQKIYPRPISMSNAGIMIQGKKHAYRLRINYRTTQEIHKSAMGVLQDQNLIDLDDSENGLSLYQSLTIGEAPIACYSDDQEERDQALKSWLIDALKEAKEQAEHLDTNLIESPYQSALRELCIVVRTKNERYSFNDKLTSWGIECAVIDPHTELSSTVKGVRIMTAHRIKGLEYKGVALVDWSSTYTPPAIDLSGDPEYTLQLKREERSLAYVAMSRARMSLFVSYKS